MVEWSCWGPIYIRVIKCSVLTFLSPQMLVAKKLVFQCLGGERERFSSLRKRLPEGSLSIRSDLGVPFILLAWGNQMGSRGCRRACDQVLVIFLQSTGIHAAPPPILQDRREAHGRYLLSLHLLHEDNYYSVSHIAIPDGKYLDLL